MRRLVLITLAVLAMVIVAGIPVYVHPRTDALRHADAIFVLGGQGYERYPYGLELAIEGYAPEVVFSNPSGAEDVWLTDLCTRKRYQFRISCFEPHPATTKGEGRQLRELAAARGWHSVIVVTFTPHISRARYILDRCFDGDLIMTSSPADLSVGYWAWTYLYQSAGYVRAALQPGC